MARLIASLVALLVLVFASDDVYARDCRTRAPIYGPVTRTATDCFVKTYRAPATHVKLSVPEGRPRVWACIPTESWAAWKRHRQGARCFWGGSNTAETYKSPPIRARCGWLYGSSWGQVLGHRDPHLRKFSFRIIPGAVYLND